MMLAILGGVTPIAKAITIMKSNVGDSKIEK